jgi:hypothetical protein
MNRVARSVGELGLRVARLEVVWRLGLRKKGPRKKKPNDNNQKKVECGTMLANRGSAGGRKKVAFTMDITGNYCSHAGLFTLPQLRPSVLRNENKPMLTVILCPDTSCDTHPRRKIYCSTLANSTLIILFSEML